MCTKFRWDWSTGSYEKVRFSRSRSKRYYRNFGESRKKVNLSESDSRDWVDQVVWNSDTCKINALTQCVPTFVQIGLPGHTKKYVFLGVVRSATIATLAKVGKKVNLSESDSRDWVDQVVWNLDTCKINILTQCVPNFVQIGLPGHTKKVRFSRSHSKRYYRNFGESRKKVNL